MGKNTASAALQKALDGPLEKLRGLSPLEAITAAVDANQVLLDAQATVAGIRRQAIRDLRASGWKLSDIAEKVGMSPQRVHQLEIGYDRRDKN